MAMPQLAVVLITLHVVLYPQITAKQYLETALEPVTGHGGAVEAKNGIRASIKSLFPNRDCFALVGGGGWARLES